MTFFRNLQPLGSAPMPHRLTDCFNNLEGVLIGDAGLELGQVCTRTPSPHPARARAHAHTHPYTQAQAQGLRAREGALSSTRFEGASQS